MAVKLITGHQTDNHILSVDARQLNRGIFGQENYRIFDGGRNNVVITPGNISISTGGLIVFGMHVRVSQTNLTYASPASTQQFGIFTHYKRDDSNDGVESVTFEVFPMSEAPQTTTIITDSNGDAYALFYLFTDNAGASISGGAHQFPVINTLDDIDDKFNKQAERVTLATNISAGVTKTLSESVANFREIEIWSGRTFVRFPTAELATFVDNGYHVFVLNGAGYDPSVDGALVAVRRMLATVISGKSFKYYKGFQMNNFRLNDTPNQSIVYDPAITKIVGVGRL